MVTNIFDTTNKSLHFLVFDIPLIELYFKYFCLDISKHISFNFRAIMARLYSVASSLAHKQNLNSLSSLLLSSIGVEHTKHYDHINFGLESGTCVAF